MKMRQYKQLELIRRVTRERAVGAQRVAMNSRQIMQNNKSQLTQLIAYRTEYNARFLADGGSGISAIQLAGYREFLTNLDNAISMQERVIKENRNQWVNNRSVWQKILAHEQALEKVVDRRKIDEIREYDKGEQKASDERALIKGANDDN